MACYHAVPCLSLAKVALLCGLVEPRGFEPLTS